jgi:hypothetical protein
MYYNVKLNILIISLAENAKEKSDSAHLSYYFSLRRRSAAARKHRKNEWLREL